MVWLYGLLAALALMLALYLLVALLKPELFS